MSIIVVYIYGHLNGQYIYFLEPVAVVVIDIIILPNHQITHTDSIYVNSVMCPSNAFSITNLTSSVILRALEGMQL
jgi:hypothetical protein